MKISCKIVNVDRNKLGETRTSDSLGISISPQFHKQIQRSTTDCCFTSTQNSHKYWISFHKSLWVLSTDSTLANRFSTSLQNSHKRFVSFEKYFFSSLLLLLSTNCVLSFIQNYLRKPNRKLAQGSCWVCMSAGSPPNNRSLRDLPNILLLSFITYHENFGNQNTFFENERMLERTPPLSGNFGAPLATIPETPKVETLHDFIISILNFRKCNLLVSIQIMRKVEWWNRGLPESPPFKFESPPNLIDQSPFDSFFRKVKGDWFTAKKRADSWNEPNLAWLCFQSFLFYEFLGVRNWISSLHLIFTNIIFGAPFHFQSKVNFQKYWEMKHKTPPNSQYPLQCIGISKYIRSQTTNEWNQERNSLNSKHNLSQNRLNKTKCIDFSTVKRAVSKLYKLWLNALFTS